MLGESTPGTSSRVLKTEPMPIQRICTHPFLSSVTAPSHSASTRTWSCLYSLPVDSSSLERQLGCHLSFALRSLPPPPKKVSAPLCTLPHGRPEAEPIDDDDFDVDIDSQVHKDVLVVVEASDNFKEYADYGSHCR